jgi:hypothetical protein
LSGRFARRASATWQARGNKKGKKGKSLAFLASFIAQLTVYGENLFQPKGTKGQRTQGFTNLCPFAPLSLCVEKVLATFRLL